MESKEIKYPNKYRSEAIVKWLEVHTLISRSALANKVGYDHKDFEKAFTGAKAIPAFYLDAFEEVLAHYGYKKPL